MAAVLAEGDGLKVMLTRYNIVIYMYIKHKQCCHINLKDFLIVSCPLDYRQCVFLSHRLATIKDLVLGRQLMTVLLKLFRFVVNVKACRQELIKTEMNTVNIMLGALNLALWAEQESGTSTKGQTITEQILQIMEVILLEASSQDPEIYTVRENDLSK